jgi:hypothetical protein
MSRLATGDLPEQTSRNGWCIMGWRYWIKGLLVIGLIWLVMEIVGFILALLFMNDITACLTVLATIYGLVWCLYKVTLIAIEENERNK